MKTTLLTAIGSASAGVVIEELHRMGHRIVGCDIYPKVWNASALEVDVFFQAVLATDKDAYLCQLEEAVVRERVDYLIPLIDIEVDILCAEKERFAALGCTVCTPDEAATRLCRNKLNIARALDASGVCLTIPTVSPYDYEPSGNEFPMMLKPVGGRSSQGQVVVHNIDQYRDALRNRNDFIAQPYIEGSVFTVEVARDQFGNVQALARQELLRTVNGLGTTVQIMPGHLLEEICAMIAEQVGIVGVVNMEFICCKDKYYFLEINPRFSGGVGFCITAGINFAELEIVCHSGRKIHRQSNLHSMILTRSIRPVITQID